MVKFEAIENFKEYYVDLDMSDREALAKVYSDDVVFTDPIHTIQGFDKLYKYFLGMDGNVISCTFDFHRETFEDGKGYLEWDMDLQMKSHDIRVQVPGVTYVEFGDKVTFHRDYFDAGAMFYENVPILRRIIKYIKKRIAS